MQQNRLNSIIVGATYTVLAVLGAVVALIASFSYSRSLVLTVLLCVVSWAVFRAAGWAMDTKLGAAIPAGTWLLVVIIMTMKQPAGDLVVASDTGLVFLLGGVVAATLAIGRTPSPRSWLTGMPHDLPRSR